MSRKIRGFETFHIFHSPYYYFFYYLNISYIFRAFPLRGQKKTRPQRGKGQTMIVTFNKENFLSKLIPSMATVSNKSTVVSIEGVLIETVGDTSLRLTTYDMLKGVRSYVEDVTVSEPGSYIINANRLLQILKVMPGDTDVTLEVTDKLNVKIGTESSSFTMFAMNGKDFPSLPELSGDEGFSLSSGVLKRMIAKTIHSVAAQDTRPALCGAYFCFEEDALDVTSCDSYTLSKCRVACKIEDIGQKKILSGESFAMIIPGHALLELSRMLDDGDDPVSVIIGVKHAMFHIGDIIFFTRLIDGDYIDYSRILPKDQTIFIRVNRERLLAGLERAVLVAEEKYAGSGRSYVKLTVGTDSLTLTSSSAGGKVYDEMPCNHIGETLEIGFNCRFLINSVRAADSEDIVITMKSATTCITIEPAEKDESKDFFYLVLPVRMNEK